MPKRCSRYCTALVLHSMGQRSNTLFLAWHAANRLIPFLPALVESLERHEHLHISVKCRRQVLSMSAAMADRLLRSQRTLALRGLSTTRAGTLLKQQIPIRTFEEWKETQPGFLEADLVAHCGTDIEGGYLPRRMPGPRERRRRGFQAKDQGYGKSPQR